jgi:hypothetical protein
MANITTTTAANAIPKAWANKGLGKLAGNLVLASVVNKDWGNEMGSVGDTVHIHKRGAVTVAAKAAGTPITPQSPADADLTVVLSKHYAGAFLLEDDAASEVGYDIGEGYVEDAAVAIAEQIEIDGLTTAYTGFTTNTALGVAGVDATENLMLSIRKALVDAKCAQATPKYCFWSTKDVKALLQIARFTEAQILGDSNVTPTMRSAVLGRLHGMDHVESQYVVTTGSAPTDTHCIALAPDALTLAMRPLKKSKSPGVLMYVASGVQGTAMYGIGIRVAISYEGKDMGDLLTVDALWGWGTVRNEFGVHVHT